jgi:N-acetylmuramoyl-L-alanine amidase
MHVHPEGPLYEGEFNRRVVKKISDLLTFRGVTHSLLVPGEEDISLGERVELANDEYKTDNSCIFVSIHGNAFNTSAKGFEVFTSVGQTRSDKIAGVFATEMEAMFPNKVMRFDLSDGDKDKESNFYVLKHTKMPALLTENFFFDNKEDAALMMSDEGVNKIALVHFNAILKVEQGTY